MGDCHTIYMDCNATTPVGDTVAEVVASAMRDNYGNPSSVHGAGRAARAIVDLARVKVAQAVGAGPSGVFFTGSATEANNWALLSCGRHRQEHIVTSIEHPSVMMAVGVPASASFIIGCPDGLLDLDHLRRVLEKRDKLTYRSFIAVMLANNETGIIQPVEEAVRIIRELTPRAWVHVDAVQALGKIPVNMALLGCDSLSLSAHKVYGPKGVGALVFRDLGSGKPIQVLRGGPQEGGVRAGTENVPGIAGFGVAAEMGACFVEAPGLAFLKRLRDLFEVRVMGIEGVTVNGIKHPRLPNTSSVRFAGVSAEALVYYLDSMGVQASAGSACSSGTAGASKVIEASFGEDAAKSTVRFSIGRETTVADINRAAACVAECVGRLRGTL